MSILTELEWQKAVFEIANKHDLLGGAEPVETLTSVLVQLNDLVNQAPTAIRQRYRDLSEQELGEAALIRRDYLEGGDYGWAPPRDSTVAELLYAVAAQIRAADKLLFEQRDHGWPTDANVQWRSAENSALVIPRPRKMGHTLTNEPYSRRGTLYHRILPARSGGYQVKLYLEEALFSGDHVMQEIIMGAAMFEGLKITLMPREDNQIIVENIEFTNANQTVAHQIEAAHRDRCFALVWPELTIPPSIRMHIQSRLSARSFSESEVHRLEVVVAGSWHEPRPDGIVNVATVYDGYGDEVLSYSKILRGTVGGAYEDILSGDELPILVTKDHLLAFAICRDFCERLEEPTIGNLDVDFILVPSLGNCRTLTSHIETARQVYMRFAARTFLVQQAQPPLPAGLGFVIGLPESLDEIAHPVRQDTIYDKYPQGLVPGPITD
jgi:hypothetical protein